jgi:alpha-beta hydrolase superfamily lysophospholipase
MTLTQFQAKRTSILVTLLDGTDVPTEFFGLSQGDAYIVLSLDGGDGATDKTSRHRFKTIDNTTAPVWNERAWLTCVGECTSLSVTVYDDNGPLCRDVTLGKTAIPLVEGEQTITLFGGGGSYRLSMTVLTAQERQTTLADQNALSRDVRDKGTYVLEDISQPGTATSVVLWIPGRNDVFMHPHVAKTMLQEGFDVCVYNYTSSLGATPADRHAFAGHVPSGTFDGLVKEMDGVVEDLQSKYTTVVVYAHSTGALILMNYLLETRKDHAMFQGIYLNSPFFDWGHLGLPIETILHRTPFLMDSLQIPSELVLPPGNGGDTFDSWRARIHTQHEYDVVRHHSHESIHRTLGFAAAAQRVFDKLEEKHHKKQLITKVPVCLITAQNDDVLDAVETIERTAWFGPADAAVPHLIAEYGTHDVFLSPLANEVQSALSHLQQFLHQFHCQTAHRT